MYNEKHHTLKYILHHSLIYRNVFFPSVSIRTTKMNNQLLISACWEYNYQLNLHWTGVFLRKTLSPAYVHPMYVVFLIIVYVICIRDFVLYLSYIYNSVVIIINKTVICYFFPNKIFHYYEFLFISTIKELLGLFQWSRDLSSTAFLICLMLWKISLRTNMPLNKMRNINYHTARTFPKSNRNIVKQR